MTIESNICICKILHLVTAFLHPKQNENIGTQPYCSPCFFTALKSTSMKKLNIYLRTTCIFFLAWFLTSWKHHRVLEEFSYVPCIQYWDQCCWLPLHYMHACSGRMVIMCHWKLFMRFFFIHSSTIAELFCCSRFHFPYLWSVRYTQFDDI